MTLGDRLRAARRAKGHTQPEAGRRLGVSRQTVGAWERGEWRIADQHVPEVAEYIGITGAELVELERAS